MSYSFSAKAATKAELADVVAKNLADVVAAQPVHAADKDQAQAAVKSLLDLMGPDDAARDVVVAVAGSIWKTETGVEQVSLSINLGLTART